MDEMPACMAASLPACLRLIFVGVYLRVCICVCLCLSVYLSVSLCPSANRRLGKDALFPIYWLSNLLRLRYYLYVNVFDLRTYFLPYRILLMFEPQVKWQNEALVKLLYVLIYNTALIIQKQYIYIHILQY